MTRKVPLIVVGVFVVALAVAILDLTVNNNPDAATGVFGTSLGALLWSWIAWETWKGTDHG